MPVASHPALATPIVKAAVVVTRVVRPRPARVVVRRVVRRPSVVVTKKVIR